MAYAVKECYYSTKRILHSLVDAEGQCWYAFSEKEDESDTNIEATQCFSLFHHLTVTHAAAINRVERLFRDLSDNMTQGSLLVTINLRKLQLVLTRLTGLTGLLVIVTFVFGSA
jgi:callose synthase